MWKKKVSDCHSFLHSGSLQLDLQPVAETHTEELVIAGDFSWKA